MQLNITTTEPSVLPLPSSTVPNAPLTPRRGAPLLQLAPASNSNTTRWQYGWLLQVERPANATLELQVVAKRVPEARYPCNVTVGGYHGVRQH